MPNPNYQNNNGKIKIKINDSWIEPQFERYENLEPIGEPGANGVVIKETHKITKREDAIKIWLPRNRNGKEQVNEKQYLKEIQKITKLNDPRIVKIYDAWKENSCYCCSMEFIAGITYEAWLKKNCDITVRINMLLKIFDAIVFYQSQGIIHGDIHLKNILIDENEEIHIIDFGTSIISSYEEQSIYRENFLMYELLEKTLGVKFDKKAFWYNKYKLQGNIEQSDDIRKAIPILFSRSVRSYLKLMIMLTNTHNIINDSEKIYEYCGYLAKGFYLNIDYYYLKIGRKDNWEMETFIRIMYESLEMEQYEDVQYNPNKAERIEFLSLFVYFEKIKKVLSAKEIEAYILEDTLIEIGLNEKEKIIKMINSSKDFCEFHNRLIKTINNYDRVYLIEVGLRTALYNIIEKTYEGMNLLNAIQNVHLRIEELKFQKELYDKIIKLSYVYCCNNGIEYP